MEGDNIDIADYFAQPLSGVCVRPGRPSDWLTIASIALPSGTLSVGDAVLFPSDQFELGLERGEYAVEAAALDYGTDRRIAHLRVSHRGRVTGSVPRRAGTIGVDFAVVGVCDGPHFLRALNRACDSGMDIERHEQFYLDRLAGGGRPWSVVTLPGRASATMVTVTPGWADGGYEVYSLEDRDRAIGAQVVFMPPG